MSAFRTPVVHVNQVGWGPTDLPEQFVMLPFNPFGKGERLGRAADFASHHHSGGKDSRYGRNRWRDDQSVTEEQFQVVEDPNKAGKNKGGFRNKSFRGRFSRGGRNRTFHQRRDQEAERQQLLKGKQAKYLVQHSRRGKQFKGKRGGFQRRWNRRDLPTMEASVKVDSTWKMVEQFDLSALTKLYMNPPKATDLKMCGHLCKYDESFERISTKNTAPLKRFAKVQFNSATTIDDPVLQGYAQEYSGKGKVVLATDELLAHLMASPRSVYPWDLYFTRFENGLMFIDKRDDSGLEMLTVNETLPSRQQQENEKLNISPWDLSEKLSIEATAVNQNFTQQVLQKEGKVKKFDHPNPLWDEEDEEEGMEPAPFAYRYRKWNLSDEITLIARTELHAYTRKQAPKKGTSYMTVYALNETNPRLSGTVPWRQKIDSARGSILASELKNNACKMGKWTAQTLLAGADRMKVGYVSRQSVKDPYNHVIIGTQFYSPEEFSAQINLQTNNMWAIVKSLIDLIYKQPPGKYVLMRDPNKPMLQIYSVPMDTFVDGNDDEDDYEDEDEEEEEE